jgi:hypothetical protein
MVAQALIEGFQDVKLVASTPVAGVCSVKGQIVDGIGKPVKGVQNILLTTQAIGTTAFSVTQGVVKSGAGTSAVWMQTTASGSFAFDVEDGTAADLCLVLAKTSDGIETILPIQF